MSSVPSPASGTPPTGPLLLDVPVLVEADHRDRDQRSWTGTTRRVSSAEEVVGEGRRVEPVLGAREPGRRGDGGEDREDDRERRGDRQDAAVPARDEEREDHVEAAQISVIIATLEPSSRAQPPIVITIRSAAETSSTKATIAFVVLVSGFSLFGRQSS